MQTHLTIRPPRRTQHFRERQAQRQLRQDLLEFILAFGTEFQARGATHLTVLERDLPQTLRQSRLAQRASGWVLILEHGKLRTCYRRQDAASYLRRKDKRARATPKWRARSVESGAAGNPAHEPAPRSA
jgi:hypothetical protein